MELKTRVDELLSIWEREGGRASAEQLCADCPEHLDEIRERIRQLKRVRPLLTDSGGTDFAAAAGADLALTTDLAGPDRRSGTLATATAHGPDGQPRIEGYQIRGPLGRGGMGVVWRAVQLGTKREVALKLMDAGAFRSERARRRFEREVELSASLSHRNIVRVYDSGVHEGQYYYAMELIEGVPLDEHVRVQHLGARGALALLARVADAVQHAHQHGIIHRDLKPSNVLVTPDGEPHVLDFGLAMPLREEGKTGPRGKDFAGTLGFMSPEQAGGDLDQIDTRSDVYSLGVILIGLLESAEGAKRGGVTGPQQQRAPLGSPEKRIKDLRPDAELGCVLLKATAADREARYAAAASLAADLRNCLACEPLAARQPTVRYVLGRKLRKYRVAVSLAAALALAAAAAVFWQYNRGTMVQLYSDPAGAIAVIDGKPHDCPTNCAIYLPRGRHEIRLRFGEGFLESVRHVEVAWGQARSDRVEPITMTPDAQQVIFESEPAGAQVVVRRVAGGGNADTTIWEGTAGSSVFLPRGDYKAAFRLDGPAEKTVSIEVIGSREARYVKAVLD